MPQLPARNTAFRLPGALALALALALAVSAAAHALKDQPVLGMEILKGLHKGDDGWDGGTILDPNNGKTYRSQLRVVDGGNKIEVRGYIGIPLLGRSQSWLREQ